MPDSDAFPISPRGRVALVGAGAFGRFCIEAYRTSGDVEVVGVADPDPQALAQVDAPDALRVSDWRVLLEQDSIEVVHVATPPFLRSEVVAAAFASGKSVFCEKPLALSLEEADGMIADAERRGVALGVNYVMRHLPAYGLLDRLAASGLFGAARSLAFHNFAQSVPPQHWFWDQTRSGGILVEHAVHFFDAYARVLGEAIEVTGDAPRTEAVDVRVRHADGALSRHYHEFAFPQEVENTSGITMFERGYVAIDGWIPTRVFGAVMASAQDVLAVAEEFHATLTTSAGASQFSLDFPNRKASYGAAIVSGMRDMVRRHRTPAFPMTVQASDARQSLALALTCRRAIQEGAPVTVAV